MAAVIQAMSNTSTVKDSRWLTLEVCREYTRNKCVRTDVECKFAHPPMHVEVQNGRVTCCFDSIKGKCQRKEPPCKYLHPPQHLKEQLLQNGRNNLIIKNLQLQSLVNMNGTTIPTMPCQIMDYSQAMLQQHYLQASNYLVPNPAATPTPYYPSLTPLHMAGGIYPQAALEHYANNNPAPTQQAITNGVTVGSVIPTTNAPVTTANGPKLQRTEPTSSASSPGSDTTWNGTQYAEPVAANTAQPYSHVYVPAAVAATAGQPIHGPSPVDVWAATQVASKKRARDPQEDVILMQNNMPAIKRVAVPDNKTGGMLPLYQPHAAAPVTNVAYQQAAALQALQLQQQQQFSPITGHIPGLPRY